MKRRSFIFGLAGLAAAPHPTWAERPITVVQDWYRLCTELVRHTPTYTPPVASRAFAYLGVTAFEAVASGNAQLISLAGQLKELKPLPRRETATYDDAVVLQAALSSLALKLFGNTGPTGQRAMKALQRINGEKLAQGVSEDVAARSALHGQAIAAHVLAWAASDGGHVIENMGFATAYEPGQGTGLWVPTSTVALQQMPLLPNWGSNRSFALPSVQACDLPPPPDYSEDKASRFFAEALEVHDIVKRRDPEQMLIARFWADDPMLSSTPPGHWIDITLSITEAGHSLPDTVDVLARLGIAVADGFIACWHDKFQHKLLRPVTYIRKHIDPKWTPLLITPPFPEYPSGHSTQSGAAEIVLSAHFGSSFAFKDDSRTKDGLPARSFTGFRQAAEEAGMSRLYGGIHFRTAVERGLEQGRCVGAYAVALRTRT